MRATKIRELGFAIRDKVIPPSDCDDLLRQLSGSAVSRSRAGARHLFSLPFIAALAKDSRLHSVASAFFGSEAVPFRVTLFDKSPESNWSVGWHQDTALPLRSKFESPGWGPWSVKAGVVYAHAPTEALNRIVALRLHLDESTATNGPLRILPGSHRFGVLSDAQVADKACASVAVECLVTRGGVLAMHPLLIHSSSRIVEQSSRRVLHIEYAEDLEVVPGVLLALA